MATNEREVEMTTATDIIQQYGRVLARDAKQGDYFGIEEDMDSLAKLVDKHSNDPISNDDDKMARDDLGLCLDGRDHWWWNCDEHSCPGDAL